MERNKENAFSDFMEMTRNSWTYGRMTEDEKKRLAKAFEWVDCCGLVGTYKQRFAILHIAYNAFLQGIGYTNYNWREPNPDEIPAF